MEEKELMGKKEEKPNKSKHALQLVGVLFLGIALGLFMRIGTRSHGVSQAPSNNLSRFETVYQLIDEVWFDVNGQEDLNLESAAIKGFLENLGDRHTMYFTNEQLKEFTSQVQGSFAGIGVVYRMTDHGGMISSVYEQSPANKAGLKAGDIILEVDGVSVVGMSSDDVKSLVSGEEGSKVVITVKRDDEILEFEATRAKIDGSVTFEIREGDIGYLDINTFGDLTHQSIEKALAFFKDNDIETIVIDLRDNTGGYLSSVQSILSLFLPEKTVLFSMQEKQGPIQKYTSVGKNQYHFKEGYILVNGETASASEVMAGALSELLDYQLIGKVTYGKGTAQSQRMLSDMSSIKYTYAKWMLPSGNCINGVGLTPDIEVDAPSLSDFYNVILTDGKVLQYDEVDGNIMSIQKMLTTLGYDTGREDGYFDMQTKKALEAFESDFGLEVDGVYSSVDNTELIGALIEYFNDVDNDAFYKKVLEEVR